MQHQHADFRPNDHSRAFFRRIADRVIFETRDAMFASGTDVGPHVRVPFSGGQVSAFKAGNRVRFEVIAANGSFADFHSGEASRAMASMMADSFN
jgi:hypothetical protein